MVRDDLRSSLFTQIAEEAPTADLVLFDLIDERLGVIEFFPRRFVTQSAELSSSGLLAGNRILRRRRLHLGDEEHLRRFQGAALLVRKTLAAAGAWEKTLLIEAPYATHSIEGDHLIGDLGKTPEQWNELYEPYYALLRSLGFRTIQPASDLLFSTRSHQWGMHPIHYQREASLELTSQMLEFHRESSNSR